MLHRFRYASQNGTFEKIKGEIEVDESFTDGKAKNMHKAKREKLIQERGSSGKTAVKHSLFIQILSASFFVDRQQDFFCVFRS